MLSDPFPRISHSPLSLFSEFLTICCLYLPQLFNPNKRKGGGLSAANKDLVELNYLERLTGGSSLLIFCSRSHVLKA
jgi:hypothetical protein